MQMIRRSKLNQGLGWTKVKVKTASKGGARLVMDGQGSQINEPSIEWRDNGKREREGGNKKKWYLKESTFLNTQAARRFD
jgi:hypothetical protein